MKDFLNIYVDMDGVIANFSAEPNAVERYKKEKGFFKNLKPIENNVKAVAELIAKGYNVSILTTSPNNGADRDKKLWLKKHLPEVKKVICARPKIAKIKYVENPAHSILFDDYGKNIKEWLKGGGLKALKISPTKSIQEYVEMGL